MQPGRYRAITQTTIELCQDSLGLRGDEQPRVANYTKYQPGEEFEIPPTINRFFYRAQTSQWGLWPDPIYVRTGD